MTGTPGAEPHLVLIHHHRRETFWQLRRLTGRKGLLGQPESYAGTHDTRWPSAAGIDAEPGVNAMTTQHYDVIIIGSGAGGGTLAYRLAPSGKRVLLLERGGYLPREPENWDSREVFINDRYLSGEVWYDNDGQAFEPHQQYFVGGNTKFYGAILFRLRERDFGEVQHYGGLSPAWPISYQDLEPYYAEAEKIYLVHGQAG